MDGYSKKMPMFMTKLITKITKILAWSEKSAGSMFRKKMFDNVEVM